MYSIILTFVNIFSEGRMAAQGFVDIPVQNQQEREAEGDQFFDEVERIMGEEDPDLVFLAGHGNKRKNFDIAIGENCQCLVTVFKSPLSDYNELCDWCKDKWNQKYNGEVSEDPDDFCLGTVIQEFHEKRFTKWTKETEEGRQHLLDMVNKKHLEHLEGCLWSTKNQEGDHEYYARDRDCNERNKIEDDHDYIRIVQIPEGYKEDTWYEEDGEEFQFTTMKVQDNETGELHDQSYKVILEKGMKAFDKQCQVCQKFFSYYDGYCLTVTNGQLDRSTQLVDDCDVRDLSVITETNIEGNICEFCLTQSEGFLLANKYQQMIDEFEATGTKKDFDGNQIVDGFWGV